MAVFRSSAPTFQDLADQALEGDTDAAFMLATRAPGKGFLSFLARWVPQGEMTAAIFDVMRDGYSRMEMSKLDAQLNAGEKKT